VLKEKENQLSCMKCDLISLSKHELRATGMEEFWLLYII